MIKIIGILITIIMELLFIIMIKMTYKDKMDILADTYHKEREERDKLLGEKTEIIRKKNLIIKDKELQIQELKNENKQLKRKNNKRL